MPRIQVIFFDFGSTLIYTKDPWEPFYKRADQAMAAVFRQAGIPFDLRWIAGKFDSFLDAYYDERGAGMIEKTTFSLLQNGLESHSAAKVPPSLVREALDALYAVTQKNWYLEDDTIPTLTALRAAGFRLGMISNTSDDDNVQQLLDRWELRPFFDAIVTSAGCGIRKPDGRIFRIALDHFNVPPEQAAMVGDTPAADILGASRMGIYSIWIIRRIQDAANDPDRAPEPQTVKPDATVGTLHEILDLPVILA